MGGRRTRTVYVEIYTPAGFFANQANWFSVN